MTHYIVIDQLVPVSRIKALGLILWQSGEGSAHPLAGTRYDPMVRQRSKAAQRHARLVRREFRRIGPSWRREARLAELSSPERADRVANVPAHVLTVPDTPPAWLMSGGHRPRAIL